ncbi:uncharacterized protein LOC125240222 [Leguminivora glycinivorella]|uniref:uncharacterized protein LOC125240222 n=1 Tax=Leguminivora glycinivorella TaxID=1035111 RepID=UPI00200D8C0D|nr:uncharacterized protein LOC125229102 isoform X1 [Leguminivora glycinivorella]XP_047995714.1 uncharacterized protein LOC125233680 isoform X1 [Leguminivora glycinivorella]XP_048004005.1 uncharacterized protein LOC125240222 [Leguminivora glycinivorella]
MADDDLKRLRAARGQSKAAITRMMAFKATAEAASSSDADPLLYQQKNDRLEKTFQEYKELNLEISLLDPADSERVEDFEEKYDLLKSFYAGVVNKALDASTSSVSPQPSFSSPGGCNASPFRLPPINLKVFAGEVEQRAAALESLGERTPSGRRSSLVASSVKVAKPLKSGINKCAFAGAAASPA